MYKSPDNNQGSEKIKIKRNNTSKKDVNNKETSENCFEKINGSDLEDLSIVESDDLYESE